MDCNRLSDAPSWEAQALQKAVPEEFELMGQRKGFVRYYSPELRGLVKQHAEALEAREQALSGILQVDSPSSFSSSFFSSSPSSSSSSLPLSSSVSCHWTANHWLSVCPRYMLARRLSSHARTIA